MVRSCEQAVAIGLPAIAFTEHLEFTVGGEGDAILGTAIHLDEYRAHRIGFIFQAFYLLPTLRAIDNVQVPMLAVNGAIEAARAGEFGKGFVVVATDIRNLAHDSSENADRIKDLVKAVQDQIGTVGRDLSEIVAAAASEVQKAKATTGDLVSIESDILIVEKGAQEILAASDEIAAALGQVKKGIEQISAAATEADKAATEASGAAQQQSKGAEDLASAIEEISSLAEELQSAA